MLLHLLEVSIKKHGLAALTHLISWWSYFHTRLTNTLTINILTSLFNQLIRLLYLPLIQKTDPQQPPLLRRKPPQEAQTFLRINTATTIQTAR